MSEEECAHPELTTWRDESARCRYTQCQVCGKKIAITDRELVMEDVFADDMRAYSERRIIQGFGEAWREKFNRQREAEYQREMERLAPEYASIDLVMAIGQYDPQAGRAMLKDHMRKFHPDHPILKDDA